MPALRPLRLLVVLTIVTTTFLGLSIPTGSAKVDVPDGRFATLGVATFNVFKDLGPRASWSDVRALTRRPDVTIVGWQEANEHGPLFRRLRRHGWNTAWVDAKGRELGLSWRRATFDLVESRVLRAHGPISSGISPHPGPARFVQVVELHHRSTGTAVTVLNTHLNHRSEDWERRPGRPTSLPNAVKAKVHTRFMAGLWGSVPGDVVIGTGDYNVDQRADRRVRSRDFPAHAFRGRAVSSWSALGATGVPRTHVPSRRWIDYVHMARDDYRRDAWFLRHRVPRGYRSDHRPVIARIALFPQPESSAEPTD